MKCDRNALLAIYVPKLTKKESRALVEEVTIVVKKALKRLRQKNRRATKKKS